MSLSKQAVADLAQAIRESRVLATAHCQDDRSSRYACFLGALESTIAHFIQKRGRDSTDVKAAFEYEPTAEEVREYLERRAKWQAEYEARKAAELSAAAGSGA